MHAETGARPAVYSGTPTEAGFHEKSILSGASRPSSRRPFLVRNHSSELGNKNGRLESTCGSRASTDLKGRGPAGVGS